MKSIVPILATVLLSVVSVTYAKSPLTDDEIRNTLIRQSIASYSGNCPCPYNQARNGSRCGKRSAWRSAWSRAGGYSPLCYKTDISDQRVKKYRKNN